jgi:hypothetical protein
MMINPIVTPIPFFPKSTSAGLLEKEVELFKKIAGTVLELQLIHHIREQPQLVSGVDVLVVRVVALRKHVLVIRNVLNV